MKRYEGGNINEATPIANRKMLGGREPHKKKRGVLLEKKGQARTTKFYYLERHSKIILTQRRATGR